LGPWRGHPRFSSFGGIFSATTEEAPGTTPGPTRASRADARRRPDEPRFDCLCLESWNEAFGFEAQHAELATPDQSAGDDDLNYYIFDERGLLFSSRSDVRTNPNTGEIRGAAAKMTAGTLTWAVFIFGGPFGATPEGFVAPAGPGGPDPFAWLGGPAAPEKPRPAWGPFAP
jgi:hypothetical protein